MKVLSEYKLEIQHSIHAKSNKWNQNVIIFFSQAKFHGKKVKKGKCQSLSHVSVFVTPWAVQPARLLCPWNSPGKNIGMGCHFLLQGIFLTQGLNPVLHCRQILHHLSHQAKIHKFSEMHVLYILFMYMYTKRFSTLLDKVLKKNNNKKEKLENINEMED